MAPVRSTRNTTNGDRLPYGNHQATRRNPRKLTVRRQAMVLRFMEEFRANPQNYSRYGTDAWMSSLLDCMNESARYGLNTEDIQYWLDTETFFDRTNAEYDYGSLQAEAQCAQPQSDETDAGNSVLPSNGADTDDATMPPGHAVQMEVDDEVPGHSKEVAVDMMNIKTETVEDSLGEGAHSIEFGPASNDALFNASVAAGSLPIPQEIGQEAQLPVEQLQGAMVRYSPATSGIRPAVLPRQTPVSSLPQGIRHLQDYSARMNDIVVDLRNDASTTINLDGCYFTICFLRKFLAEVEEQYVLVESVDVEL